jgi:hypothetical protein
MREITVGCDETGVWCEHPPGACMHVPWAEVARVTAVKYDYITYVETILEFEHESGHVFEINDGFLGFEAIVGAVGHQYSLVADWYAAVDAQWPRAPTITVWQRADNY